MNIIVTGGSKGIGFEVARNFALDLRNKVIVISRNGSKLKELKRACLDISPDVNLHIFPFDLENLDEIGGGLYHKILEEFSSLDVLINNAGLLIKKPLMELSRVDIHRMMSVNYIAPVMLVRALMPLLESAATDAHVVNIGSMAGVSGGKKFPGLSAYSASKAALHCITECMAVEFAGTGVRFNALAFGAVQTEMLAEAFPGLTAPLKAPEMAVFVEEFARTGHRYFNGKILQVSISTP